MGIRIQPREIDVPEKEPFKNDLLDRKESAEVLTHIASSIEGPCVLAIDAAWGTGKTTFLRIWSQYLHNQKIPVVSFNAWETDHSGDPFVALSSELTEDLQNKYKNGSLVSKIAATRKAAAREILRRAVSNTFQAITAGILDISPLMDKEFDQNTALSEYQKGQRSIREFRYALQDMAEMLSKSHKNKPLIVIIDELDRCRPSYAVELLEVAKHLFTVEHIVFVLAVNRSELEHSIKALYGSGFDAEGYLRRFFDVDFRLPDPERDALIVALLDAIQIENFFRRTQDRSAPQYDPCMVRELLQGFFGVPDLSLRRIAQAIHRLGLVFVSLRSDQGAFSLATVVALIVRTIDSDLYHRFVRGDVSDLDVVNAVFHSSKAKALREKHWGCLFETTLIKAREKMVDSEPSELRKKYKDMLNIVPLGNKLAELDKLHAGKIISLLESDHRDVKYLGEQFDLAVQRLELLSTNLIDDNPGAALK